MTLTQHTAPPSGDTLWILDADAIDHRSWLPVDGCPGVAAKQLWRSGDFVHSLIRYEPGATTDGCPHLAAHHHLWVVAGHATVGGELVRAGTYVHIPPGVAHQVIGVGPQGCIVFQVHRPLSMDGNHDGTAGSAERRPAVA